jgi:hypothetical protein
MTTATAVRERPKKAIIPCASESQEQKALIQWATMSLGRLPELYQLFAIPNGANKSPAAAAKFKAEGLKPGVPDLFLAVPRGEYHGLFVEMKRRKGGVISPDQEAWLICLSKYGYAVSVCLGWEEARDAILQYLEGK